MTYVSRPNSGDSAVYDFVEVAVAAAPAPAPDVNPFTDLALDATLTPPGGKPLRVDGFCDAPDGGVFRVRFLPRVAGPHTYRLALRQGGTVLAETEGVFTARDAGRPGPVRVDPEHPWHFVHEGTGEHYFYNGTTAYWLLGWDEAEFAPVLDRLQRLGVNRVRVALSGRVASGLAWDENVFESDRFTFRLSPWPVARPESVEDPGYDVSRFDVAHWQKAERLIAQARARGIQVSVIFYLDGARPGAEPFGKNFEGGPDEERYYRYAAARLAAFDNVMWDVTNEYRLFRTEAWAKRMGAFLKNCDPYGHLTSVHGHGTFTFREEPWADYALYQSWDEHGGNAYMLRNREMQRETGRIIPQVNEEYGYEDHYPKGWGGGRVAPARSADSRRRLAWEIAMAGCYQTTGERAEPDGGWINGRGSDDSTEMLAGNARILEFFRSFEWWRADPANQLARAAGAAHVATGDAPVSPPLCLAEPGRQYAVWLPHGGAAALLLAPGRYRAHWFDPRTGAVTPLPDVAAAVGGDEWASPLPGGTPGQDWALLLTAAP